MPADLNNIGINYCTDNCPSVVLSPPAVLKAISQSSYISHHNYTATDDKEKRLQEKARFLGLSFSETHTRFYYYYFYK